MRPHPIVLPLIALLASATLALAQGGPGFGGASAGPPPRAQDLVTVRLATDESAFVPGGTVHLAVVFDIAPRWHTYWENSGAGGGPPRVTVEAPEGFTVGAPLFPRPVAYEEPVGRSFVYFAQTVVFVPITAPETAAPGVIELKAAVSYLVCRDVCVLGRTQKTISVPVAPAGTRPHAAATDRAMIDLHRGRLPRPLTALTGTTAAHVGDALVVTGPARGHDTVEFFPIDMPGVMFDEPEIEVADDMFRITVPVEIRPHNALGATIVLRGVIGLGSDQDAPSFAVAVPPRAEP